METATRLEVSPMLAVNDAAAAIEFYKAAFGAIEEGERFMWEGKVGHAEIRIAETGVKLADEFPGENQSPKQLGGTTVILHLDVADTDASFDKAVQAGAEVLRAPQDFFYGRVCKVRDPFGHVWMLHGPSKG